MAGQGGAGRGEDRAAALPWTPRVPAPCFSPAQLSGQTTRRRDDAAEGSLVLLLHTLLHILGRLGSNVCFDKISDIVIMCFKSILITVFQLLE